MSPHSSRAAVRRLAIALAGGALAAAVVVTPAAAHTDPRDGLGTAGQSAGNGRDNGQNNGQDNGRDDSRRDDPRDSGRYRGVVTADKLALRSAPNRGSRVIRYAHRGEVVSIYCKTPGDSVKGNPLWYLLTDGTWAWGAARYIDNIGPAPRWC
ncbi:SH3 domain-containing protein [Streptomyces sp. NPDC052020]|uniref:SH3 domain-containing protein n=1 Tax=Streptomyces sp. NPDC052020 TaxID=3155677 RepID=UPI0034380F3A